MFGHHLFIVIQDTSIISFSWMISPIMSGLFRFAISLTFFPSSTHFMPMYRPNSGFVGLPYRLTMAANLITMLSAASFLTMAFTYICHARTHPSRTARPNALFERLTTVCARYFFIVQLLHSFGRMRSPRQRSSSTDALAVPLGRLLHTSFSSVSHQTTPSFASSAPCATPTWPPWHRTSSVRALPPASSWATRRIIVAIAATSPRHAACSPQGMSCSTNRRFRFAKCTPPARQLLPRHLFPATTTHRSFQQHPQLRRHTTTLRVLRQRRPHPHHPERARPPRPRQAHVPRRRALIPRRRCRPHLPRLRHPFQRLLH